MPTPAYTEGKRARRDVPKVITAPAVHGWRYNLICTGAVCVCVCVCVCWRTTRPDARHSTKHQSTKLHLNACSLSHTHTRAPDPRVSNHAVGSLRCNVPAFEAGVKAPGKIASDDGHQCPVSTANSKCHGAQKACMARRYVHGCRGACSHSRAIQAGQTKTIAVLHGPPLHAWPLAHSGHGGAGVSPGTATSYGSRRPAPTRRLASRASSPSKSQPF